jgi:hypothetical protein
MSEEFRILMSFRKENANALSLASVDLLRSLWQQAREDNTPGIPIDEAFDRLERKYQALVQADEAAL